MSDRERLAAGDAWVSTQAEEVKYRLDVAQRLTALEKSVLAIENRREENKWWIRTTILLASAVGVAASAVIAILNRWLP